MFCSKCGSSVLSSSKFCGSCGNPQEIVTNREERRELTVEETALISSDSTSFLKTYLKVSVITLAILFILFWIAGSYEEDGGDAFIGTFILAGILALLITFFIKGRPENKQKNALTKSRNFFGSEQMLDSEAEEVKRVKKDWNNFIKIFWWIFFLKIIAKGGGSVDDVDIASVLALFELVAIGAMVITMGYYSYKFSGKKSYWLFGLLGFLWVAIIGIFLGYWQVQRIKDEKLGKKAATKSFRLAK